MSKIDINNYEAFLLDFFEGNLNENDLNELKTFAVLHPELNIDLGKNELPYFSKEDLQTEFKSDLFKSEENLPDERVIAYMEGTLSQIEKEKFEIELQSDKSLEAELKLYSQLVLQADDKLKFDAKNLLMKSEDEFLMNNKALLYVEGLLAEIERTAFETEIKSNATLKSEIELFQKTKLAIDYSVAHPDKEGLKKENKIVILFSTRSIVAVAATLMLIIGLVVMFNNFNSNVVIKKEVSFKNNILPKNEAKKQLDLDSVIPKANTEQIIPEKNYVASKNPSNYIVSKIKKDTLKLIEESNESKNIVKEEKQKEEIVNSPIMINDTVIVSNQTKEVEKVGDNSNQMKQTTLLAYEEDEEVLGQPEETKKTGFWNRAARLAKQANGLGIKAVNGEEKGGDKFMLSFNAFSVEKK